MREEQFLKLPSQGNIYSTSRIGKISIVGSGNHGKVFAQFNKRSLEELKLCDLPKENIDIISIDSWDESFPVLGVTYVDTSSSGLDDETKPAYLHIFSALPSSWKMWCFNNPIAEDDTEEEDSKRIIVSEHTSPPTTLPVSSFVNVCRSVTKSKAKQKYDYILDQLHSIGSRPSKVIKLDFIPYHLCHVWVQKANDEYGNVFLLSGSDKCIHTFEPSINSEEDSISFSEVDTRNYFPELPLKFESIATRIAVEFTTSERKRVTMIGCEDGKLLGYIVPDSGVPKWSKQMEDSTDKLYSGDSGTTTPDINSTSTSSLNLNEDCSCALNPDNEKFLKLLSSSTDSLNKQPQTGDDGITKVVNRFAGMITAIHFYFDNGLINAVVSSSASPVYCYKNILGEKFKSGCCLKFSTKWDSVQSVCIADVDFDGENEIVIGTFGCTLLVYKFVNEIQNWAIVAHRKFPSAIFSITFVDYFLNVVTASGLHLIEYSDAACFLKYGIVVGEKNAQQFTQESAKLREEMIKK